MDQVKIMALNSACILFAGRDVSAVTVTEMADEFEKWLKNGV